MENSANTQGKFCTFLLSYKILTDFPYSRATQLTTYPENIVQLPTHFFLRRATGLHLYL